jgi:hypothetical protein
VSIPSTLFGGPQWPRNPLRWLARHGRVRGARARANAPRRAAHQAA